MGSRGKPHRAAGELVFGVNNPAVFLRKILGLFSMAKRQNSSMHPYVVFHSAHLFGRASFSTKHINLAEVSKKRHPELVSGSIICLHSSIY